MDEGLKWLFLNADKISVIGLLFALVLSLQRQWLVPGWAYAKCAEDLAKFEAKAEMLAAANDAKIMRLEAEVAEMRDHRGRSR